jgi:hypothetical protein
MSKHTPTPYKIGYGGQEGDDYAVIVAPGRVRPICNLEPLDYTPANARFIVRACNSHEALLEASKGVDEWFDLIKQNYPEMLREFSILRAAIAAAEKED